MPKANLVRFVVRKNGHTGIYLVSSNMFIEEVKDRMDKETKQDPVFGEQCLIDHEIVATAIEVNADWVPYKIISKKVT